MNRPILVIMAAGIGSRYGGLKQIAGVDNAKHILIDYSLFDAKRAGFETVVFIITQELEKDFREVIGDRIAKHMEVRYAFQLPNNLPKGFSVPEGRTKPWGTAHAILSAKEVVDANFAAINADDFYGASSFKAIYDFLSTEADGAHHAMVGYKIENTLTEHGHVARGICKTGENGKLTEVVERTHIVKRPGGAAYTEDGDSFVHIPEGTVVSMNMWGFGLPIMEEIESRFSTFLSENLPKNPLKCEYFLPSVPNQLLREGKAEVKVLTTSDRWYGVTYKDDMPVVREAIARMKANGEYPEKLLEA